MISWRDARQRRIPWRDAARFAAEVLGEAAALMLSIVAAMALVMLLWALTAPAPR